MPVAGGYKNTRAGRIRSKAVNDRLRRKGVNFIAEDEGVIEIVFTGKTHIDDFGEAKEQMSDWFYIIEGYAKLLDATKEDFEIIGISKNSPAKFKIKSKLPKIKLFLVMTLLVLDLNKAVLENVLLVEKFKKNPFVKDPVQQEIFTKEMQELIDSKINDKIREFSEAQMRQHNKSEGHGDIYNNLTRGAMTGWD